MANNHESPQIDLAIVGGGIAGLCFALGILRHAPHIRFHIYEASPKFAEIGAGVAFGSNALRALFAIDERLEDVYQDLKTSNVEDSSSAPEDKTDGSSNEEIYLRIVMGMDHKSNPDFKAGTGVCEVKIESGIGSVHRAKFLDALVGLLPDHIRRECVTFGARLVSIEKATGNSSGSSGVKLEFADGRIANAAAVIGCDGVKSQVRQQLLGAESPAAQPVFSGKYAYRGLVPMDQAVANLGDKSARSGQHRVGYDGHVLTFPIDKGRTMNVVAFRTKADGEWSAPEWIQKVTKDETHEDFVGWGKETHSIIDMMTNFDRWALFDHAPAPTYHEGGRICIVGDAAHASTPHHGAGAGMAVEDAYLMAGLLADIHRPEQLQNAFAVFEDTRKERTQRLVKSSREQAEIYEFQAPGLGDDVVTIGQMLPRRWDWIWDYDVYEELRVAKASLSKAL